MAKDTESHTIRLLQEMRSDMQDFRQEVQEGFADVNLRIDGLTHMMVLLSANMGGHSERLDALESRVDALEAD